jgi:hypothetical protein
MDMDICVAKNRLYTFFIYIFLPAGGSRLLLLLLLFLFLVWAIG